MAKAAVARAQRAPRAPADPSQQELIALRQHVDNMMGGLRTERYSWWTHWRELADYILPRRYKWLITPNQGNRGSPINQRIIDSTGTLAARVTAAGLLSGMTSPTSTWFRLTIDDAELAEYWEVKVWLDEVARRMRAVLAESNFYNTLATMYGDLVIFGTAPMLIYEDYENVINCFNTCAGEYYLANGKRGNVDTFYREFVQTTSQVVAEFGLENCSPTVQQAVKTGGAGRSREIIVCHAIEPNDRYVEGLPGLAGMAYREVFWEYGSTKERVLRVRGYNEAPFVAPRWDVVGNDAYGRSPGMDALGDIKQLQVEQKRKAQAIDKMVNPPLIADVALKNEPASVLPGGVTYVPQVANGVGFKPAYEVKPDLQHMVADIQEVQNRIKVTFFNDLFQMWANMEGVQPRNELEIMERKGEKLIQIGSVIERFGVEALDPALTRIYNVMGRARLLPPAPKELQGRHVKVEYVSMLAQAQKATMTTGIEQLASFIGRIGAAVPEAMDNADWDDMIQKYAEFLGTSPTNVRPFADVLKMRKSRAQEKQAAMAVQMAGAAAAGGKVLSETDVGGGQNALQMMLQ